jgi:DNA-binding MarR family transcriptional regulator
VSELDRVIHEPARLLIVALLHGVKEADFLYLLRESDLTKGNLSSHLAKLEQSDYVEIEKTYRGKVPLTIVRLTKAGRAAFETYRKSLSGLLGKAK